MRQFFYFIGGLFLGAFLMYLFFVNSNTFSSLKTVNELEKKLISELNELLDDKDEKGPEVQHIEIKVFDKIVTLYTGMSKDSVKALLGQPGNVWYSEIGRTAHEDWGYATKSYPGIPKDMSPENLTIKFENGILKSVSQY